MKKNSLIDYFKNLNNKNEWDEEWSHVWKEASMEKIIEDRNRKRKKKEVDRTEIEICLIIVALVVAGGIFSLLAVAVIHMIL